MQIHNWKKTSDFYAFLTSVASEGELIIVLGNHVDVGWFHVALIKDIYPHKKIFFVTRDIRTKKLLKQSGYRVFHTTQEIHRYLPEGFQIVQENLTVLEYIFFNIHRFFHRLSSYFQYLIPKKVGLFDVKHSSWYMLILGIITVLLLMIGIISLTTPHASVIIRPQTSIQNAIKNVVFVPQDELGSPEQIPLQKDIFPFVIKKTYRVNTFDPLSLRRAEGTIKITHIGIESLRIRPQTRLVAGPLVFRTQEWIEIPAVSDSRPGEVLAKVVAEPIGTDGILMGKRGNVSQNTALTFPGLTAKDHENIVVVAHENFSGGENTSEPLFTQEEYNRIEKVFREQILNDARSHIIEQYDTSAEFIPLPIPDAMETLDITLSTDISVGEKKPEVTFSAKSNFLVYLYHQPTLRKILLQSANSHLLEHTESLIEISQSPPDIIATLTKTEDPFMIKATAQIPVQILYDFSSHTGQKTLQNILADLLDADADRAEKTLLNHPYIRAVDIRLTPFWSKKLPNTLEKIYIKVEKVER